MAEIPTLQIANGVYIFQYPGETTLKVHPTTRDMRDKMLVEALAGEHLINQARIDLLDLRDHQLFHEACAALDGHVNWSARLLHVTTHVPHKAGAFPAGDPGAVWSQALTAHDFLLQPEADVLAHVKDLVVPGCITAVSAPRASGKSLVALYLGVALATGAFSGMSS
jgi:hypothetical protein